MSTASAPATPRGDWRLRIGVPLGTLLLRLLALTWRVEVRGESGWRARRAQGQGTVLTLWHGHLLPLTHHLRNLGTLVLVSEHRDGEIIARILQRLGYGLIRGSSTRGGARAFAEMVRALKSGETITITPDGPRGPARKFSPGAAVAAQRAAVPIVTMFVTTNRAWTLKSWDSFMIPKPFARLVVHFSDPTFVKGTTPSEVSEETARFEALTGPRDVVRHD